MTSTHIPEAAHEPGPAAASTPSPESRAEPVVRRGQGARLYAGAFTFVTLLTILIVLSSKNTLKVKLDWAVGSTHASLVWIILAAAIIGWLLGIATAIVFRHRTRGPARAQD